MKISIRRGLILLVAVLVLAVVVYTTCTAVVPTGYTGILTTFGRVEDYTMDAGLHMKNPFQAVVLMDNREQKTAFTTEAFSSDIQQVEIVGSVNFAINKSTAMTLYKEVGTNYFSTLVMPRLLENTKATFSKFTAENLVAERENLSITIRSKMMGEMEKYGINIISVSIENIDFTDSFTDAVESKQVAAQKKLQAEIEQEQATMETKQAAERQRITAEAEAAVKKIEADAAAYATKVQSEAEAEANRLISASLTDHLISWVQAKGWDGKLPTYMSTGEGMTLPILNLQEKTNQQTE
ncbi:MAG: prohibitin family protein [Clostridiales bacterium]|nr:prohibitin family protein [Clostridia bacterium]MCR4885154.1 prohibitin family protein [Clostridiales bacterium]